jgi:hypothetical protein
MNKIFIVKFLSCSLILLTAASVFAQKRTAVKTAKKPIIFAVLNDGARLEPIAHIEKGKLTETTGGDADAKELTEFSKSFYLPKTNYRLVFGGADAGTVTVKSSNSKADCAKNTAEALVQSAKAKLKGMVMGLATDATTGKGSGVRRLPTASERAEIESLVRGEFAKQKVSSDAVKNMKYHNLTALDIDGDGVVEMVGSFWSETAPTERGLLFFIADKNKNGKYSFGFSEYKTVKQDDVMSGEIKDLDSGIYHELLLDVFDYDADGAGEIFTYVQSFEGAGFNAYRRAGGKWTKTFEGSNYHCGY